MRENCLQMSTNFDDMHTNSRYENDVLHVQKNRFRFSDGFSFAILLAHPNSFENAHSSQSAVIFEALHVLVALPSPAIWQATNHNEDHHNNELLSIVLETSSHLEKAMVANNERD